MTGNSLKVRMALAQKSIEPRLSLGLSPLVRGGYCWVCGTEQIWRFTRVINDNLAREWQIDEDTRSGFDARESMFCPNCHCSFRLREMARALCAIYQSTYLKKLVSSSAFNELDIAEINSCGELHKYLNGLGKLRYSEFGSKDPKIRNENLEKLSYPSNVFDLVLHSDTLEHVPNYKKALAEIYRVLKRDGYQVFTAPVIWQRKNKTRAYVENNQTQHREPLSYHGVGQPDYLVFSEFGYNFIKDVEQAGFSVKVFGVNLLNLKDPSGVIIAKKGSN